MGSPLGAASGRSRLTVIVATLFGREIQRADSLAAEPVEVAQHPLEPLAVVPADVERLEDVPNVGLIEPVQQRHRGIQFRDEVCLLLVAD